MGSLHCFESMYKNEKYLHSITIKKSICLNYKGKVEGEKKKGILDIVLPDNVLAIFAFSRNNSFFPLFRSFNCN